MAYTQIIFEAEDAWLQPEYSFKVNLISREVSIAYLNNHGGHTTNGMKISDKQCKRIRRICNPQEVEKFRVTELQKENWLLDPNYWKLQITSDDGNAVLILENKGFPPCLPPSFLVELVEYVFQIAAFDNFGGRVF